MSERLGGLCGWFSKLFISRGNHHLVFKNAGFEAVHEYTYWDKVNKKVDIAGLTKDLMDAPDR